MRWSGGFSYRQLTSVLRFLVVKYAKEKLFKYEVGLLAPSLKSAAVVTGSQQKKASKPDLQHNPFLQCCHCRCHFQC